jgi:tetraacyldisaccharide 4'-kinase
MKAPAFWFRPDASPVAQLLRPAGYVYGAIASRLMARPGAHLAAPAITIGNFVVGGAGKTPTALAVGRMLIAQGQQPAFLSRGYGGRLSAGGATAHVADQDAREVGDEPLLLRRVAPTFVGPDRAAAAAVAIEDFGARVLVLDDGLQSRRIEPDVALAVVDGATGVGNGLCLPAGPLRAPLAAQLRHVTAVVIVGPGEAGARVAEAAASAGRTVLKARLEPDARARAVAGRKVVAFAGIGRPEKFFATMEAMGADVVERHAFADHHFYRGEEIERLRVRAQTQGAVLVTTEKDAVRLPPAQHDTPRIYVIPVTLVFDDAAAAIAAIATAARRIWPG